MYGKDKNVKEKRTWANIVSKLEKKTKTFKSFVQRLAGQVSRKLEILGINDGWFTG